MPAEGTTGVTVVFENLATDGDIQAMAQTLEEFNLEWPIERGAEVEGRGGIAEIAIFVQVVAGLGIARFFDVFVTEASKSGYQWFGAFLARLRARHWPRRYEIQIRDEVSGHVIEVGDDLPANALAALEAIDFDALELPVVVHWDADSARWVVATPITAEDASTYSTPVVAPLRQARYKVTWSQRGERGTEEPLNVVARLYRAEMDFVAFYKRDGQWDDAPTLLIRTSDVREIRELTDDG